MLVSLKKRITRNCGYVLLSFAERQEEYSSIPFLQFRWHTNFGSVSVYHGTKMQVTELRPHTSRTLDFDYAERPD